MAKEKLAITCSQPRDDLTVSCRDTTGAALQMCDVIGKVVLTIFKIKGETLTIAGLEDGDQDQPKTSDSDKTAKIVDGNGTPNLLGFEPSAREA